MFKKNKVFIKIPWYNVVCNDEKEWGSFMQTEEYIFIESNQTFSVQILALLIHIIICGPYFLCLINGYNNISTNFKVLFWTFKENKRKRTDQF